MLVWTQLAAAHQPHDPADLVAVSPAFAEDGFVLASRYPNQNWRPLELAVSVDGGATWRQAIGGLSNLAALTDIDLSATFATDGMALVTTAGDSAWLTTDRAASWSRLPLPDGDLLGGALTRDASGPVLLVAPAAGGLSRSTDGGATWVSLPGSARPAAALAARGAGVAVAVERHVLVSTDGAATFTDHVLDAVVTSVAVGEGVVAAGTGLGVYLSLAGGPFTLAPGFPAGVTVVGVAPDWAAAPTVMATLADDGVYVSDDGGATASRFAPEVSLSPQTTDHYYSITFSGSFPEDPTVFVGAYEGLLRSADAGRTWRELDLRPPGLVNALAVSPRYDTDGTLLVASYDAGMWASFDRGRTFSIHNDDLRISSIYDVAFAEVGDGVQAALALNAQVYLGAPPFPGWDYHPLPALADYTSRIALSPRWEQDGIALVGTRTNGVWRTDDGGTRWRQVTGAMPAVSGLRWGPDGHTVLAGARDGRVLRSADDGASWEAVAELPRSGVPTWIDAGPTGFLIGTGYGAFTSSDGAAFDAVVGVTGPVHQAALADDGTGFLSLRGGGLWRLSPAGGVTEVAPDLAAEGTVAELAVSPRFGADPVVFAALEDTLWRSTDRGDTFHRIGMGRIRYEEDAQALVPGNVEVTAEGASVRGIEVLRPSDDVTLTVRATGFTVLGATGPDLGTARVEIDGVEVGEIDQQGPAADQVEQFVSAPLPDGLHTLRLVPTSSWDVHLDAIDVLREVPPWPNEDSGLLHTGAWDHTGPLPTSTRDPEPPADGDCGCRTAPSSPVPAALLTAWVVTRSRRWSRSRTRVRP